MKLDELENEEISFDYGQDSEEVEYINETDSEDKNLSDKQPRKSKKSFKDLILGIFGEIFKFSALFTSVLIIGIVFVNFNIFYSELKSVFFEEEIHAEDFSFSSLEELSESSSLTEEDDSRENKSENTSSEEKTTDSFEWYREEAYQEELDSYLSWFDSKESQENIYEKDLEDKLFSKNSNYDFTFNLKPPDNRIIIPSLGVDAPIVNIEYVNPQRMMNEGNFEEELYDWVVKYPFTPEPWEWGNTFIFGHTSYYWRKNNPYWEVFANMPDLSDGDKIKIMWEWNLHVYQVSNEEIMRPDKVTEFYNNNKDEDAVTLMWCYPIGSDAQRILIQADKVEKEEKTNLAFND